MELFFIRIASFSGMASFYPDCIRACIRISLRDKRMIIISET
jgi:hypothetical protein